jgi:hypothetical protein
MSSIDDILAGYEGLRAGQEAFYKDPHEHPELSHSEHRTARRVVEQLRDAGFTIASGIGGTGVAGETAPDPGQVAKRVIEGFTQRKLPDRWAWLINTAARDAVRQRAKARWISGSSHPRRSSGHRAPVKPCCVIPLTSRRDTDGPGAGPGRGAVRGRQLPHPCGHFDLVLTAALHSGPHIVTARAPVPLHVHDRRDATSHRGSALNRAGRRP